MRRITLALLALTFGLLGVGAAPAQAASGDAQYPPPAPSLTLSATRVQEGSTVTVRSCGYREGSRVRARALLGSKTYTSEAVTAGADGCASIPLTLTRKGKNTIIVSGHGDGRVVLSATVRVTNQHRHGRVPALNSSNVAQSAPASQGTGTAPLWAGGGLLAAGLLVTGSMRRRFRGVR